MQAEVEALFPPRVAVTGPSGTRQLVNPRATGKPDFSIEGGKRPLDVSGEVDLPVIPGADFRSQGHCEGLVSVPPKIPVHKGSLFNFHWSGGEV